MVAGDRGGSVFREYLDNPAANDLAFVRVGEREWFRTGDLAERGSDGTLFVGGIDGVIKVAGENVSLTEVEAAVAQARGVLEAAVLSRPDAVRDHVTVAHIVPRSDVNPPSIQELESRAEEYLTPPA